MTRMPAFLFLSTVLIAGWTVNGWLPISVAYAETDDEGGSKSWTYDEDIRPILKTHCFHCHGEGGVREGGLDLRLRRLIMAGGDSGPVIVPGQAKESLLLARLQAGEMPPEEVKHRPTSEEIAKIAAWIDAGAPAGGDEPPDLDPDHFFTSAERNYWAFQPLHAPPVPTIADADRIRTPIDAFVSEQLAAHGLRFAPDADRPTLIRRLYFDLLGLPPEPEEVEAFEQDPSADAYERVVDRLLASPRYGERWGRHWLDVAGYADSEGFTDDDPVRPDAYKYRDYVIASFNADKPFDRFIVEQLAGDELIGSKRKDLTPDEIECLVATGFLRMAPDGTAAPGVDQDMARNEVVAKTIQIVSTSLLGLTVGCAQCHDHRYDPIPQADYYAFRAIFEPAYDWKHWLTPAQRRVSLYTDADRARAAQIEAEAKKIEAERAAKQAEFIRQTLEKQLAKLPDDVRERVRAAVDTPAKERTPEQHKLLKEHPSVNVTAGSLYLYDKKAADTLKEMADAAARLRATKPREEFVRALWEPTGAPPPATYLFYRGDPAQPKQEMAPAELSILAQRYHVEIPDNDADLPSTGRRLNYARWLTSGEHPLVARVLVNRVWMHHFGRGIVATPGDFGRLGTPPTHPELLDWLAHEWVASGWSLKHLHRLILTSTVYRQSSVPSEEARRQDSGNRWLSHRSLQRLDAETLRDSLLSVSGQINLRASGPAVPVMADQVGQFVVGIENLNAGRPGPVIDMHGEQYRRTVYIQVRRSRPLSVLEPFDWPAMEPNCTARHTTTVATQSLLVMNSQELLERAAAMAERVRREAGAGIDAQVRRAWRLVFAAGPTDDEVREAVAFVELQRSLFASQASAGPDGQTPDAATEAMTSLCHVLLSSNRFLYVD